MFGGQAQLLSRAKIASMLVFAKGIYCGLDLPAIVVDETCIATAQKMIFQAGVFNCLELPVFFRLAGGEIQQFCQLGCQEEDCIRVTPTPGIYGIDGRGLFLDVLSGPQALTIDNIIDLTA